MRESVFEEEHHGAGHQRLVGHTREVLAGAGDSMEGKRPEADAILPVAPAFQVCLRILEVEANRKGFQLRNICARQCPSAETYEPPRWLGADTACRWRTLSR